VPRPPRLALALVTVTALVVTACSDGSRPVLDRAGLGTSGSGSGVATTSVATPATIDSAAEPTTPPSSAPAPGPVAPDPAELGQAMVALSAGLPDEPQAAARALVDLLRTGTDAEALAATAELARRAGFAIVSVHGDVVAVPDEATFSDIALPAELLGNVTRSVRSGALYSVDSVGNLLFHLDTVDGPMPWPQLAHVVSAWGKDDAAPPFIRSAAATVRALSGERGDVFSPAMPAAEQGLDALQVLIITAHAGGVLVPVPAAGTHGFAAAATVASAPSACDRLSSRVTPVTTTEAEKLELALIKWGWGQVVDGSLDYAQLLAELPGSDAGDLRMVKGVRGAVKAWDVTNKVASYVAMMILLLGTTLDLSVDNPVTHYKHTDGSTAEEVTATARVTFDSALSQERLACYGFAGLDVPKNGPIAGINVRWSLGQDLRPGARGELASSAHLRPTNASIPKFRLDRTDGQGQAQVVLKPAVEEQPGVGRELRAAVQLTAHVEKGELPFSLADLTSVLDLNVQAAVIGKTIDALKSIAVDELLPTARTTIAVRYHGVEPVVVKVDDSVNLVLYEIPRVYADLVSCTGIEGPYTGTGGYSTVGIGDFGQWASGGLGALGMPTLPASSPAQDNPLSVMPAANGQPNQFLIAQGDGAPFVEGVLTISDRVASTDDLFGWVTFDIGDGRQGQPVGELELLLGGNSWPFSDLTGTVYRVATDARCPDQRIHFDDN